MKAISLNVWHGTQERELRKFLCEAIDSTDIFCFQEANKPNIENMIGDLFGHDEFSLSTSVKLSTDTPDAIATITRRQNCEVELTKELLQDGSNATGNAIVTYLKWHSKPFAIVNIHGAPRPGDKLDTPGRILQSQVILEELKDYDGEVIITGDFNLEPHTESIRMIEQAEYRNLISEYAIETTRNSLAWNRFPDNKQLFADYMFISPDTKITSFTVPSILASDHLPMVVEIGS